MLLKEKVPFRLVEAGPFLWLQAAILFYGQVANNFGLFGFSFF